MKFKTFIIKAVTANSGISSKRICGFMGGIICLCICIYCTIKSTPAPDICEMLFICSVGLLGLDSVTQIGKPNYNFQTQFKNENKNEELEENS